MNKRLLILSGVILLVSAISVALLLFLNPGSTPDPGPTDGPSGGTITLPDGSVVPADKSEAVNKPEPDGERNPDGTLKVKDPHFGNEGIHADEVAQCGDGPFTLPCDGEEAYTMPSSEAISKASAAAKNFAEAWLTITPSETPEARQARLSAAGGIGGVPAQVSALTRPKTQLTGLVTSAVPYGPMYAAFTRVTNGDIVLVLSLAASVNYTLNDVQSQTWSMPGTMLISVNPTTDQITSIVENFPDLEGMS